MSSVVATACWVYSSRGRNIPKMFLRLVLVTLLVASTVSGSIYPTFPVASSVLHAGRLNTLRWIDDKRRPSIKTMGPVKIDLYAGDVGTRWLYSNGCSQRTANSEICYKSGGRSRPEVACLRRMDLSVVEV